MPPLQRPSLQTLRAHGADVIKSPGFHTGVYFFLAGNARAAVWDKTDRAKPHFVERLNLGTMPLGLLITAGCQKAWPQHADTDVEPNRVAKALLGGGIAALTLGSYILAARQLGWLRREGWGWQKYSRGDLLRTMVFLAAGNAAIAYNEEMVFRGHGWTILGQAIGPWLASGLLIPLFAKGHEGKHPKIAMAFYSIAGFNYTVMRVLSGGLTMPMAHHWTWNWLQSAVFGAKPDIPSLCPVIIDGPDPWVGTIGESSPGLLMLMLRSIIAVILGWLGWHSRQQKRDLPLRESRGY